MKLNSPNSIESILLDIEGTVSPVSYVYEVLFPFARKYASEFLHKNFDQPSVQKALDYMARDAGFTSKEDWLKTGEPIEVVLSEVNRLMDADIKATGLKELQGIIWKDGYNNGVLMSELFADVPDALSSWDKDGKNISIYSSGSIGAQKIFFAYTKFGDMSKYLDSHFDTTSGGKKESSSYKNISKALDFAPSKILFLSDIVDELDAAREAGVQTILVKRDGNAPQRQNEHQSIKSLAELDL
ncbi:MAG: acireductone synthase [Candidatus Melainabacteria bacterium]|nr:acireductone synthase [Candidatus Melainabacteria bacterium]